METKKTILILMILISAVLVSSFGSAQQSSSCSLDYNKVAQAITGVCQQETRQVVNEFATTTKQDITNSKNVFLQEAGKKLDNTLASMSNILSRLGLMIILGIFAGSIFVTALSNYFFFRKKKQILIALETKLNILQSQLSLLNTALQQQAELMNRTQSNQKPLRQPVRLDKKGD